MFNRPSSLPLILPRQFGAKLAEGTLADHKGASVIVV
jgi:hypothetical protein